MEGGSGSPSSDGRRLRLARLSIIRDPPTGQEEQCYTLPTTRSRVVVGTRTQACPSGTLPILIDRQPFELEGIVDADDAVDLAVRMLVVLACVLCLRIEVDGRDGHVEVLCQRELDLQCTQQSVLRLSIDQ